MAVTLTIDGKKVTVPEGTTVLEAAQMLGIDIPTFCYEKDLTAPGACRICVVEIEGWRNLPASCVTAVAEGMVVHTESPAVVEARRTILELLIANHPLDCMTCEKSGNCKLQDYAYRYGVSTTRFQGERHNYPIDDSNPYIIRDLNKCILCGKCVATCNAVPERSVINFAYRGFQTKIATALDTELKDSDCVYCNRCVAVCPVGALVDKMAAGKGRAWELEKEEVTCVFCEAGCRFNILRKQGKVVAVTAAAPGPGRPLCLKGRLGMNLLYNPDVPKRPLIKKDGKFTEVSWQEALGLNDLLARAREMED